VSTSTRVPQSAVARQPKLLATTAWKSWGPPVAVLLIAILIWWILAMALQDRARIFSSPSAVVEQLWLLALGQTPLGSAYGHLGATLGRLVAAFVLSMAIGGLLGIAAGRIKDVFDLLDNVVWIFLAVPSIVWVFIFAVAMGRTNAVPIAALSALMIPIALINVAEGAKAFPAELLEMSRAFGVGARQRVVDLYLPYLVPYFLAAARITFALGIKVVIIAEVVALTRGVGYLVLYWRDAVQMAPIVAWGVVLVVIGIVADYGIFAPIERRVAKWRAGSMSAISVEVETVKGVPE
jgi:ABC-type nitrate/sulfonate/bicarbonate transport system permease component